MPKQETKKSNHSATLDHVKEMLDQATDTLNTMMNSTDLPDTPRTEIVKSLETFHKIAQLARILYKDVEKVHADVNSWFRSVEIKYPSSLKMHDMDKRISFLSDAMKSIYDITDIDIPQVGDLPQATQEEDYDNFLNDFSWSLDDAVVQSESAIADLRMAND